MLFEKNAGLVTHRSQSQDLSRQTGSCELIAPCHGHGHGHGCLVHGLSVIIQEQCGRTVGTVSIKGFSLLSHSAALVSIHRSTSTTVRAIEL
eukprot:COSAG01_NODE_9372_length_2464_cov_5.895560_2_plen_92_part_00